MVNSELTAEERNSILTLRPAGLTVRGTAVVTKRSVSVCSKILSAQPSFKKPIRHRGKAEISKRDRRHIIRLVSVGDISPAKVEVKLNLTCTLPTIQHVLKSVDWLFYKKRPSQPLMTKGHKEARAIWASEKALGNDV